MYSTVKKEYEYSCQQEFRSYVQVAIHNKNVHEEC